MITQIMIKIEIILTKILLKKITHFLAKIEINILYSKFILIIIFFTKSVLCSNV